MSSVVWRAPGRVNLIGEHTDYNGGFALPLAIGQGCTASVERLAEPVLRVRSSEQDDLVEIPFAELAPGRVEGWAAYVAGVVDQLWGVWAIGGVSIEVDSDVPQGAGLSSSAALTCSVAAALDDLLGLDLEPMELVAAARVAENDYAGAPTGGMDQLASVCCTEGTVLLCDMQDLSTRAVPMDLVAAGLTLLVIDTNAPHRHSDGEYRQRRESCEAAAAALGVASLRAVQELDHADVLARLGDPVLVRRARHILTENVRVHEVCALLDAGDVAGIGPLLTASHESMCDDYEITVREVDLAVSAALGAGALGARMTGGGFGGCVIALVPASSAAGVLEAVTAAFADEELTAPSWFETHPHPGVHSLG